MTSQTMMNTFSSTCPETGPIIQTTRALNLAVVEDLSEMWVSLCGGGGRVMVAGFEPRPAYRQFWRQNRGRYVNSRAYVTGLYVEHPKLEKQFWEDNPVMRTWCKRNGLKVKISDDASEWIVRRKWLGLF